MFQIQKGLATRERQREDARRSVVFRPECSRLIHPKPIMFSSPVPAKWRGGPGRNRFDEDDRLTGTVSATPASDRRRWNWKSRSRNAQLSLQFDELLDEEFEFELLVGVRARVARRSWSSN